MYQTGLGVTEEKHTCPFPSWFYSDDSPCSAKHNPENKLTVDTTTEQREWWEKEEQEAREKGNKRAWADLIFPVKVGAVLILGAVAYGLYVNLTSGQRSVFGRRKSVLMNPKRRPGIGVFVKHRIKIAKDTLKMSDAGASVMGGMTKEEARTILQKYGVKYKE